MTNTYKLGRLLYKKSKHLIPAAMLIFVFGIAGTLAWTNFVDGPARQPNVVNSLLDSTECASPDENVCKFLDSWKVQDSYSVTSKVKREGVTSVSTYAADGAKSKVVTSQAPGGIIIVNGYMYTQDSSGTWLKQPVDGSSDLTVTTALPDKSSDAPAPDLIDSKYKYLATEKCGDCTCYKYKVIDTTTSLKQYIWFDTTDFQLRRTMTIAVDGTVTDSTIAYEPVAIEVPAEAQVAPSEATPAPSEAAPLVDETTPPSE